MTKTQKQLFASILQYKISWSVFFSFDRVGLQLRNKIVNFFADYSFLIFLSQRGVAYEREGGMSQVERVTEFTLLIRVLSVNVMFCCPKKRKEKLSELAKKKFVRMMEIRKKNFGLFLGL